MFALPLLVQRQRRGVILLACLSAVALLHTHADRRALTTLPLVAVNQKNKGNHGLIEDSGGLELRTLPLRGTSVHNEKGFRMVPFPQDSGLDDEKSCHQKLIYYKTANLAELGAIDEINDLR